MKKNSPAPAAAHKPMKRFWIYFRGTRNGQHIEAATLPAAKIFFAQQHNGRLIYTAGRKV